MLQRVAMGQVRFNVPGLGSDSRGVVFGRQMVLRFSALGRLVSFLRLWSAEQVLDDLQPGPRVVQVRTPGGAREALLILSVTSLSLADAAVRAARLAGGQCFTGSGKHFVQYRDQRAPLGYDVANLETVDGSTEFVLYGTDHTLAYAVLGEFPLDKLLLRLDLQRQYGATAPRSEVLFLTVRRGLGPLVIAYLHRALRLNPTLRVSAALCEPPAEGTFQRGAAFWILRLEDLPMRLGGVLSQTPGLTLLAPVAENIAIAVGYRHPVHLGSCKQVFPSDRLFLFCPAPVGVTIINPSPTFSSIADLVRLQPLDRASRASRAAPGRGEAPPDRSWSVTSARPAAAAGMELVVPLRLEAAPAGVGRPVATIVPWDRMTWLRSLCYALPPSVLRGYRLAVLEAGLLVIAHDVLDGFPFGRFFHAPAPGLLVPLGWQLRPAIAPDELAARVGATAGALVLFPGPGEAPVRIPADALETLETRALGDPGLNDIRVEPSLQPRPLHAEPIEIQIDNQPLGPMPLWRLGR
jgi:hypothetical protein